MAFKRLGLKEEILDSIEKKGFKTPTSVQELVIPLVLEKKDLIVQAKTGTGKTASFVLPLLELWHKNRDNAKKAKIKVLTLAPTRELALQIAQDFTNFSALLEKKPKIVTLIGGEKISQQLFDIQQGCDILVATSGRFLDVLRKKQMDLSHVSYLVLDEADKMINADFMEELDLILEVLPPQRQNLLFSATYPEKIAKFAKKITQNALELNVSKEETLQNLTQRAIKVNRDNRGPLLRDLLQKNSWRLVLVFMASKRASDNIAAKFRKYKIRAASFNADLDQENRNITLRAFKEGKIQVLFATDIAARGLDIDNIDCVINYDLPRSSADYIHRVGRTARAAKTGEAISFVDYENMEHFKLIEKRNAIQVKREEVKGFELVGQAPIKSKGAAPVKGKKKSKKDKLREQKALEKEQVK